MKIIGVARGEYIKLINESGLSPRQREYTLENYICETPEQKQKIDSIIKASKENKWIFLEGNPGTGKDHIASAIAHNKMKDGYSVRYINTFRLLLNIQSNFLYAEEIIDEFSSVELLVLNEIEKTFDTAKGNEKNVLFEIIDTRYNYKKQTIFITNSTWENIHRKFALENGTNPITDRISEMGIAVRFGWASYRQIKG